jgi:hypothetical protein
LNALLEEPGRSTALAETASKAEKSYVDLQQVLGPWRPGATGSAADGGQEPNTLEARPPLFGRARSSAAAHTAIDAHPQPGTAARTATALCVTARLLEAALALLLVPSTRALGPGDSHQKSRLLERPHWLA